MANPLYIPPWICVLAYIHKNQDKKKTYAQRINKTTKLSINYLRVILREFRHRKVIEIIPKKNIKQIYLTDKGNHIATDIINVLSELSIILEH